MIAVDTNILVYAHRRDSRWSSAASAVLTSLAGSSEAWAIPWPCVYEFVAICTHPRVYAPPSTLEQALRQVDFWLESPGLGLLSESASYYDTLRDVLHSSGVAGGQVHDARIAALCLHHGVTTLYSADRNFSRFRQLKVENPLV